METTNFTPEQWLLSLENRAETTLNVKREDLRKLITQVRQAGYDHGRADALREQTAVGKAAVAPTPPNPPLGGMMGNSPPPTSNKTGMASGLT